MLSLRVHVCVCCVVWVYVTGMCFAMLCRDPANLVQCLTPNFREDMKCVSHVANSGVDDYVHNLEAICKTCSGRCGWAGGCVCLSLWVGEYVLLLS